MFVVGCDDLSEPKRDSSLFKLEIRTHCQASSLLQGYASIYRSLELRPEEGQMTQEIVSAGCRLRTGLGHITDLSILYDMQSKYGVRCISWIGNLDTKRGFVDIGSGIPVLK